MAGIKDIARGLLNRADKEAKETTKSFVQDHPIATGAMCVMGVVIFAQHIELKCLRAASSQNIFVL